MQIVFGKQNDDDIRRVHNLAKQTATLHPCQCVTKGCASFRRLTYAILYDFFSIQIFVAHSASGGCLADGHVSIVCNFILLILSASVISSQFYLPLNSCCIMRVHVSSRRKGWSKNRPILMFNCAHTHIGTASAPFSRDLLWEVMNDVCLESNRSGRRHGNVATESSMQWRGDGGNRSPDWRKWQTFDTSFHFFSCVFSASVVVMEHSPRHYGSFSLFGHVWTCLFFVIAACLFREWLRDFRPTGGNGPFA